MSTQKTNTQEFPLAPLPQSAWLTLVGIWLLVIAFAFLRPHSWVHPAPHMGNPVPTWLVLPFVAALAVVGPLVWMQRRRIAIDAGQLLVQAGIRTRKLAIADFDLDNARILDLDEHVDFKPMLKLAGMGLPGFKSGTFLLRNRSRAFCLLVGGDKALLLPLREDTGKAGLLKEKLVLLSPSQPQALLARLRELQAAPPR